MREFDVVVIGAGVAGEVAAGRLGENGVSVAIVEDRLVGGECSYYACMPSKALLRPVELAREVARVPGLEIGPIDVAAVLARRDEVIAHLDDTGQLPWLEERGRHARAWPRAGSTASAASSSGGEELVARKAVIVATGSSALDPRHRGAARGPPVDEHRGDDGDRGAAAGSRSSAAASSGSSSARRGPRFGSQVTLVHRGERADRAGGAVRRRSRCSTALARGRGRRPPGAARWRACRGRAPVVIELDDGTTLEADEVLAAFGRVPGTATSAWRRSGSTPDGPLARRRRPPRAGPRLAVRDRRRQRPGAADAHGQVPGQARRRHDPRPRRASCARTARARRA